MAEPRRAPSEATVPINLHWNQKEGYFATPQNPDIDPDATAQLNASDKSCTICFNPTTTPFGTCQNVKLGDPPIDIPVGPTNFTVNYCITDYRQPARRRVRRTPPQAPSRWGQEKEAVSLDSEFARAGTSARKECLPPAIRASCRGTLNIKNARLLGSSCCGSDR